MKQQIIEMKKIYLSEKKIAQVLVLTLNVPQQFRILTVSQIIDVVTFDFKGRPTGVCVLSAAQMITQ